MEATEKLADIEAEESLIGALLMEPKKIQEVSTLIGSGGRGVFSEARNDDLYAILAKMAGDGDAIDVITVGHAMHVAGKFASIGMRSRLIELMSKVVSAAHARHHARIVLNYALIRRFVELGHDISRRAPDVAPFEAEITKFSDDVEESIRTDFGRVARSDGAQDIQQTLRDVIGSLDSISNARAAPKTGLDDLDNYFGCFTPGQLVTIGARTGGGKTSLAMQVVAQTLLDQKSVVLVFSMEMTRLELVRRLIAAETGVSARAMHEQKMSQSEWEKVQVAIGRREKENLIVDETGHPTVGQIQHSAERVLARHGRLDLIVCDGVQLMHAKAENRAEEIGRITRGLKALAKDVKCPLIITTQLHRGETTKQNKLPYLDDIKESSSIEQDSDIVLLLWRADGTKAGEPSDSARVNIAKHRNGPTGVEYLTWSPQHMTFRNAAPWAEAGFQ